MGLSARRVLEATNLARPSQGPARYTRGAWQTRPYAPWTLDTPSAGEQGPQALRRHPHPFSPQPRVAVVQKLETEATTGWGEGGLV